MADVNQLYQNISQSAQDVKNTYAGLPTFESNIQQNLVAKDPGLTSSLQGYTDKVAELFAHDKQIADNWSTSQVPTNLQPEGFMEDPYAKSMASASLYAQKGKETASALNLYETRKNFLGNIVDKALKVYEAGIKGKEIDYQAAKDEFDNALKLAQLEETKRSNLAGEDIARGKLTPSGLGSMEGLTPENVGELDDYTAESYAKQLFGPNSIKGSTQPARGQYSRDLIARALTGDIDLKVVAGTLDAQQSKLVQDTANFIKDAQKAETGFGTSGQSYWGSKIEGTTGPIAGIGIGASKERTDLLNLLNRMKAETIKEYYGSAFTTTEMKNAGWIIGPKKQEFQNLSALRNAKDAAYNKMYGALKAGGMSDEIIDLVAKSYGITPPSEYYQSSSTEEDWE